MTGLIDLPPVWLAGFIAVTALLGALLPGGTFGAWAAGVGILLAGAGAALMIAAVAQMALYRTTVIPRRQPATIVTTGVFRLSRNPIYLGDALILAGLVLWFDVPAAAPLVCLFVVTIRKRFILQEESGLRAAFPEQFAAYAARTRRWI